MYKLIGKGAFTKAYQISETEVEIISTCPSKECYAMFSQDNPLAPKIQRNYDKENAYLMPLYTKITAPKKQLNSRAYNLYTILRSPSLMTKNLFEFIKMIQKMEGLTGEQKENIMSLAEDVCNGMDPEDMRFEISPRNISCDSEGNLVMVDCFFSVRHLKNSRERK